MPVYNTRELIPFVNGLELQLNSFQEELNDWSTSKGSIMNSIGNIPAAASNAINALVKADEAMSEIGTATFDIIANRGQRLKTLIDELKKEMVEIAENTGSNGSGGGGGYHPRINAEINNAISQVDGIIEDGLKLDYRLQEITNTAQEGKQVSDKSLIIPTVVELEEVLKKEIEVDPINGAKFVSGEVTVLNENKEPIIHPTGDLISGTVTEEGLVVLNFLPLEPVKLYFPVEMALKDVPHDVMYFIMDSFVQKSSQYMKDLLQFKEDQQRLLSDIQAMKGENWTVDFSIMRNHKEIIEEAITPKGLHTEIIDGMSHLTFSYNDHPQLSHFEVDKWDETENKFVPYDGDQGIVYK